MITALVITLYLIGWMASTVAGSRWVATTGNFSEISGHCHDSRTYKSEKYRCVIYHDQDCWYSDGEVTPKIVAYTGAVAIGWPILIFPATAYALATARPTAPMRERIEIEEAERNRVKLAEMTKRTEELERAAGIKND